MVPHRLPICTPSRLMQGLDLSDDNDDGDNTTTKEEEEEEVVENVLVLYGSQSHVSRGVAEEIHCNLPRCLSPDSIGIMTNCDANPPRVRPILCSLDEFLDDGAPWTRHVVIVVSSFGNGGAPSNAKRFRKFCDAILSQQQQQQQQQENATTTATTATASNESTRKVKEDNDHDKPGNTNTVSPILLGIQYHLLALGDSCWWKTFLKNPTVLDQTLQALGATRVGEMGVADANEKSKQHPQPQKVAIAKWTQGLWYQLADAIVEEEEEQQPANPVDLESCSRETMRLYKNLVKTTKRKKKNKKNNPRDW